MQMKIANILYFNETASKQNKEQDIFQFSAINRTFK